MTHSIELLKKARKVGATHVSELERLMKAEKGRWYESKCDKWFELQHSLDDFFDNAFEKIDFTPLDDYQQDKALDIAATGIAE